MLDLAATDLRAVELMVGEPGFDDAIVGFHAQQAMEKSLKAWLAAVQGDYPFVHQIAILLENLEACGESVDPFVVLARYSVYAVRSRYGDPPEAPQGAPLDRAQALTHARTLFDHVQRIIQELNRKS